jgi:hypothetical protein
VKEVTLSKERKERLPKALTGATFALVCLATVGFALINVLPYLNVADRVLSTALATIGSGAVFGTAIVSEFVGLLTSIVGGLLGFILWAALQLLELLPVFLATSRKAMRSMLASANGEKTTISDNDDADARTLKKWLNRLALLPVRRARKLRVVAYATDLAICLYVYPLRLFPPSWWHLAMVIFTLFVVEICLKASFTTHEIYRHYKS